MLEKYDLNTTPVIPMEVYHDLPPLLKEITEQFEDHREKDVVLTSCLTILSGCFAGIKGKYGRDWVGPALFSFIVAPPANGKGVMKYSIQLGKRIQEALEDQNKIAAAEYDAEYRLWKATSKKNSVEAGDPPMKPKFPILFIPGNSSAASIYWLLYESDGKAIICETEADSLAGAIKQDWGNFSHILRCAFQHEPVTVSRKVDSLYLRIDHPELAVLLTGTPEQVPRLIGSSEDGLCSRFLFYTYSRGLKWIDPTPCNDCIDYKQFFGNFSSQVARINKQLNLSRTTFSFSTIQFETLNENFKRKINSIKRFEGSGAASAVIRLGLIAFRIGMILTVLRNKEELKENSNLECSDQDFRIVMKLVDVYFEHSMAIYSMLPKQFKGNLSPKMREFYTLLPDTGKFPRKQANEMGAAIGISEKSVGNYLKKLVEFNLLVNPEYGYYEKIEKE